MMTGLSTALATFGLLNNSPAAFIGGMLVAPLMSPLPAGFIAGLAALVPTERVNLTQFYGVFAPNGAHQARVTPAKRGKGKQAATNDCLGALASGAGLRK